MEDPKGINYEIGDFVRVDWYLKGSDVGVIKRFDYDKPSEGFLPVVALPDSTTKGGIGVNGDSIKMEGGILVIRFAWPKIHPSQETCSIVGNCPKCDSNWVPDYDYICDKCRGFA